MEWFWKTPRQDEDPTKHLDPRLREFLRKETPEDYIPATAPPEIPQSSLEKLVPSNPPPPSIEESENEKPRVPRESLFPDGRYAHLWKTYTPLSEIEASQNTDKMRQVVEIHKERRYQLGKAALENCAEENTVLSRCFETGGIRARMTMCKRENRQFARCYEMQSKFLSALGYASLQGQDPDLAERIQMHADSLYHRMLAYERSVKEAKAAGLPPPTYQSVFPSSPDPDGAFPSDPYNRYQKIPPNLLKRISTPLQNMSPAEQDVEIMALKGELRVLGSFFDRVEDTVLDEHLKRLKRKEKMKGWIGEWATEWIIPDPVPPKDYVDYKKGKPPSS